MTLYTACQCPWDGTYPLQVQYWKIKAASVGFTSLQASAEVPGHDRCSSATVQQGAASLACMLGAVYTSQRLRLLSAAIVQQRKDAARALESHPQSATFPADKLVDKISSAILQTLARQHRLFPTLMMQKHLSPSKAKQVSL